MPALKYPRRIFPAVFFCAAACFSACGSRDSVSRPGAALNPPAPAGANLAEPPLDRQIEQKLDPLTKEDVELYLNVMRAAAQRVKNLTPEDRAALDGATKILAGGASGRVPSPADVRTLAQANLVALSMDQIIAVETKLDGRAYRGIAEAVEAAVPDPAADAASGDRGAASASPSPTLLEKRLNDVNAANEKFLAPNREEIQKLIAVVRNPANLPK